ncbi:LysM peptidoglycan-binding domain-containing protein [Kineococcus radiotolerans]|uniref:Peptidoglycan-binding LysM n=1 Tax=Kineococcus radiotolerans (strain ATCC BAA-149 / DSM 14245 / SRS30216) TaxID=266940 RepID=A6WD06_KINRD|nr:LysM peptidoglycan-binding domain-containing protein [Kineococcus radiotolerans]ABS04695.1 Peptidoglycan-binding LysM [Kineococcus radiotolerans SRS30216 = ATCC BAA-149]
MADDHDPTDAPEKTGERSRRGRWLAAALVGAAAPTALVPAAQAAPAAAHAASPEDTVTVRAGDTVGGIARRAGTTVEAIVEANGLDGNAQIVEGQQLRVPRPAADGGPAGAPAGGTHTVRAGETLSGIALTRGTTVAALREANGLSADGFIREGQELTLPGGTGGGSQAKTGGAAGDATYTVRAGDTLSHIALSTGVGVEDLVALNGLDDTGFIVEGQQLRLGRPPAASTPARPATPAPTRAATVSEAVEVNRARIQASSQPGREEMREIIRSTAVKLGVDPSLALAIGYQESGFNMKVVSHANAIGAMQVIPSSGEWASDLLGQPIDLFDARDNARAGVAILRTLVANNPPDVAIASYYQGQASVRSRGMYDDTRRYVANVQTLQARFS